MFSRLERNFWRLLEMPSYSKHFEGIWKGGCLETSSIDPLGCYVQNFREGQPNQWIFSALGFTKDCCYMDWLHAVDHGAQVHDSVFFHSNCSRPFFGPCFFQDPNFSGHCFFFALLFPRPKTRCSRLGVTPDFLGNLFWYTLPKLAPTRKAAVQALWQELRQWYSDNAVENRMLTLTETMLRKKANSSPKVRSKAAEAWALVPFGVWFLI